MKLEQQVCSLELAKRLKDLGVKQEGAYSWVRFDDGQFELRFVAKDSLRDIWIEHASAFTVAELGWMLPIEYISQRRPTGAIGSGQYCWWAGHYDGDYTVRERTEADARAKMLIYILENKLITLP